MDSISIAAAAGDSPRIGKIRIARRSTFLRFASIRLILKKLCNPLWTFGTDS